MIDVHIRQDYHDPDIESKQLPDNDALDNQDMDTLAIRLRTTREAVEPKLTQAGLAKKAGCSTALIGNLETGQATSAKIPAIANALGVEALWLAEGKGLKYRTPAQAVPPGDARFPIRRALFKLSAGASGYEVEYENGESRPIYMDKSWFELRGFRPEKLLAVKVTGRSMEPSLYEDDLVVINTEDIALKDSEVFAANYEGELVIKRLKRDGGQWYLASDNPNKNHFGDKLCDEGCGLIGRIVYRQTERI